MRVNFSFFHTVHIFAFFRLAHEDKIISQPSFTDMWGYTVNWTDPEDGWNEARRRQVLNLRTKMKKQMSEVPHFTKNGYKKMKMPGNLHQFLLERRNLSDVSHEDCKTWDPSYNCQKIVKTVAVPFRNTNRGVAILL